MHVAYLDVIFKLFPDANVVWLHRDPMAAIPSCCSMFAHSQNISVVDLNPREVGKFCLEYWAQQVEAGVKSHDEYANQVLNVRYEDLIKDPILTVKKIYKHFDIPSYSDTLEQELKAHLSENKQHKHGSHAYSLEEFGLSKDQVLEAFKPYYEKFIRSDTNTDIDAQMERRKEAFKSSL